ncbi:MAG: hypothetical protein J6N53_16190 [Lachnospiraceae bacterium]|nr:hypothetical protein [Lachnospiraceae bacterium]MBP3295414.1 hypothetical protein [Lachnospiraceae bacterium]MCR5127635.1 hypothetical protein [Lachnospiraceae bacterium]
MADNGFHDYKCPNCGGPLAFRGDLNKMVCEYCDSQFDMSEFSQDTQVKEEVTDWQQSATQQMDGTGMKEYVCNTCAAVLVAEENVGATECPYCGNPLVIKDTFEGINLPDGIIPFAVDKAKAQEALHNFYKGKKLIPDSFIDKNRIDNINGLYVPFWLFDCDTDGDCFYRATKEREYDKGDEVWKEIEDYAVTRSAKMRFEKVPADASKEMKDAYMDSLEPFDYSKITDYNPAYMSGYVANKYDEDANAVKERVDGRIRSTAKQKIRDTVKGYSSVNATAENINIRDGRVRYCMLPVWMLSTQWNGQVYSFAMNGQSGKVVGDLPIDSGKSTKLFLSTALITAVIATILLYFILGEFGTALIASIVIGLIVGGISLSSAKAAMVASEKTQADHFLVDNSFALTNQLDRYTGTRHEFVRKRQTQNNNN